MEAPAAISFVQKRARACGSGVETAGQIGQRRLECRLHRSRLRLVRDKLFAKVGGGDDLITGGHALGPGSGCAFG